MRLKTFRKLFFYTALAFGVVLIAVTASVFLFKDKMINQFIRAANKQLNTPIKVGKIDVSLFTDFPHLAILMRDVYVEDSHPGNYPLLTARNISFQMNLFEVWNGIYNIRGLRIEDSETNLKINDAGKNNYTVLKKASGNGKSITFELKQVNLKNTRVAYFDMISRKHLVFTSQDLVASIATAHDVYTIAAEGELTTETINVEGRQFSTGKSFEVESNLVYDDIEKSITIEPSLLTLKKSAFTVSGVYTWKEKNRVDLETEGKETTIQTLLSLLPESIASQVEKYQSKGDVYFQATLKGEISKANAPAVSVNFGFKNATIFHPAYKSRIEGASLTGSFASQKVTDPRMATLVLKDVEGTLNDEPFTANFIISDFTNPEVICSFKGRVDAAALSDFYPVENLKDVTGSLVADISLEGKLELLKNKATAQRVYTHGTVDLHRINLTYGRNKIPLRDLTGSLQFSNNDLALSNVSGKLGKSDFLLNGFFKNIVTYLLFEDQPVGIEADLKSKFLDVNELLDIGYGTPSEGNETEDDEKSTYQFAISRNVYLNFNCDVKGLHYKRFRATGVQGDLLVKNRVAVSRKLALKTMGGNLTLSGIVDATNNKAIDVVCTSSLAGIHLDSVFYVFENFDQQFIRDSHLKGSVTADVNLEMALNQNLRLYPETLIADISALIRNGELNQFEPIKKLNRYLDDEGLNNLRFADIKNDIHIEKKTIYIPQMQVRSNVTDIKISGTHTFDQHIDYRLIVPLRSRKKINEVEAGNALENDGAGQTKLFLKILGTADDYRIVYDTEAVRKKIASDLKKEVQELKDAFKHKGEQKKKELELDQDEYFDW